MLMSDLTCDPRIEVKWMSNKAKFKEIIDNCYTWKIDPNVVFTTDRMLGKTHKNTLTFDLGSPEYLVRLSVYNRLD